MNPVAILSNFKLPNVLRLASAAVAAVAPKDEKLTPAPLLNIGSPKASAINVYFELNIGTLNPYYYTLIRDAPFEIAVVTSLFTP